MDRHPTNTDHGSDTTASQLDNTTTNASSPSPTTTTTTQCAQEESSLSMAKGSQSVNVDTVVSNDQVTGEESQAEGSSGKLLPNAWQSTDSMSRKESVSRSDSAVDEEEIKRKNALVKQSSLSPSTPPFVSLVNNNNNNNHNQGAKAVVMSNDQDGHDDVQGNKSSDDRDKSPNEGEKSPDFAKEETSSSASDSFVSSSATNAKEDISKTSNVTIGFGTIDASLSELKNQSTDVVDGSCLSKWSNNPMVKGNNNNTEAKTVMIVAHGKLMEQSVATGRAIIGQSMASGQVVDSIVVDEQFPPVNLSFPPLSATISDAHGSLPSSKVTDPGFNNNNVTTPVKSKQAAVATTPVAGSGGKKKGKAAWKPLTVEFNTKPLSDRDIRGQSGRISRKGGNHHRDHDGPPGGHPSGNRRTAPGGSVSSDGGIDDAFRGQRRRNTEGARGGRSSAGPRGSPFAGNGGSSPHGNLVSPLTIR